MNSSQQWMIVLVQNQLEAYNQRNLDLFCKCYHPEVSAWRLPSEEQICQGAEDFRKIYQRLFTESPSLYCDLKSRTFLPNSIIDEEWVTGRNGQADGRHVSAIYFFKDQLIHKIYFV